MLYFPALPCSALVISTPCHFVPRSFLPRFNSVIYFDTRYVLSLVISSPCYFGLGTYSPGHFSVMPFRPQVISVPCHFGHLSVRALSIFVMGHFGPGTFWSRFNRPSFWTLVISIPGHFGTQSFCSRFILVLCYFCPMSLPHRTFRFGVISMPYHFISCTSRPKIILLVYVAVRLGSVYFPCNVHSVDAWCGLLRDYFQGLIR